MTWFGSKLGIRFSESHNNFSNWLIYAITNLKTEDLILIAAITYGIWFARNKCVFEFRNLDESTVINMANNSIMEYQHAVNSELPSTTNSGRSNETSRGHHRSNFPTRITRWSKPRTGTIKINCDANLAKPGRWGLGASYRDSDGVLVAAATWETPGPDDSSLAEAAAIYKALHLALECCFLEVIIESDNRYVISLINSEKVCPRNYVGTLVLGVKCNRHKFRHVSFRHVNRDANKAAHLLASLAHLEPNRVWLEETPPQLVATLVMDLIH
jgi:ribonuclease HI